MDLPLIAGTWTLLMWAREHGCRWNEEATCDSRRWAGTWMGFTWVQEQIARLPALGLSMGVSMTWRVLSVRAYGGGQRVKWGGVAACRGSIIGRIQGFDVSFQP